MKMLKKLLSFVLTLALVTPARAQVTPILQQSVTDVNYILNGGFESSAAGWKTYKDAAQAMPVDGAAGSPSVTIGTSTNLPLAGKSSGILTHPASNVQGEGWSYDFKIDRLARTKMITISLAYEIVAGTYSGGSPGVDSDVEAYIYDVDAAQVIQPSGYKLDGGVIGVQYGLAATFQASATSTNYRLILHNATATTASFQLKVDQIKVGLQQKSQGPPVGSLQSFTPTGSWTTNATYSGKWRQDTDMLEMEVKVALSGAPTAANLVINLPPGLSIDTAKLVDSTYQKIGDGELADVSATVQYGLTAFFNSATSVAVYQARTTSGTNPVGISYGIAVNQASPATLAAGDIITMRIRVPIAGWSSSVTMSSDAGNSGPVSAKIIPTNAQTINTTDTQITFGSVAFDKAGIVSGNSVNIPSQGLYKIYGQLRVGGGGVTNGAFAAYINGVAQKGFVQYTTVATAYVQFADQYDLKAGDVLTFYGSTAGAAGTTVSAASVINIEKLPTGSQQIAASDSVAARAATSAGQTVTSSLTTIVFGQNVESTHGVSAYDPATGIFTAPSPGRYSVKASILSAATALSTSSIIELWTLKNGTNYSELGRVVGSGATLSYAVSGSDTIRLLAGETLKIGAACTSTISLYPSASHNFIAIERVGNY
jgi:hypothetical protein